MCNNDMTLEQFAETVQPDTITGYYIDVQNETHGPRTIARGLKGYYDLLGCRLIDMTTRQIGVRNGRRYTIVCDDESMFADQPKISAIDNLGTVQLVGNLFIVKVDEEGNTCSLDQDDIEYLEGYVLLQCTHKFPRPYPMLHQCEYA